MAAHISQTFHPLKSFISDVIKSAHEGYSSLQHRINVAKEREELRNLDNDRLRDLGITREQAQREANRGFWDV